MYGFYPMLRTVRLEFGFRIQNIFSTYGALRFITFSSHKDMVYKKKCLARHIRKITVYRVQALQEDTPYTESIMSEYISTNSGIHHQFRINYKGFKGSKASQLWVLSCNAQIQWVASGKKYSNNDQQSGKHDNKLKGLQRDEI